MIESFPQLIIQLYFLFQTDNIDPIIFFSIIFSLISITNKAVNEDKPFFINYIDEDWQEPHWKLKKNFVSWRYILRLLFRLFDISSRVLIIVLVWFNYFYIFFN